MTEVVDQAAAVQDSIDLKSGMVQVLFSELDIQRVVSVDDSWEHDSEGVAEVTGLLFDDSDLLVELVRLLREFHSDLLDGIDLEAPQAVADFLDGAWSGTHKDFRARALDAARASAIDGQAVAEEGHGAYEPGGLVRLRELIAPFMSLDTMGHTKWRELYPEVSAAESGVLVLFDRDFSTESGGSTTTGEDLVRDLIQAKNPLVRVAMLTRSVETEDEELEETRKLEATLGIEPGSVVVVGKYRLKNLDALPGALRVMLLAEQIEAYRSLAAKALTAAVEAAQEELDKLQRYTIMGAIASGQKEGSFELDPPLRLVRRAYDRALRTSMRETEFAEKHLEAFRSGASGNYLKAGQAGPQLARALRADLFEDGSFINSLGLPVELGDIFETSWLLAGGPVPRKYILLSQACDISVREKGLRAPEVQTFVLHEFRTIDGDHDVRDGEIERLRSIGPYEDDMRPWGINLASQLIVPAIALDATVFHGAGEALLEIGQQEGRPMAHAWVARQGEILRQGGLHITAYRALLESLGKAKPSDQVKWNLMAGVLGTSTSGKAGISALIDLDRSVIQYGLRRVGRLLSTPAAGLLATAAAYQGRPAFDAAVAIDAAGSGH